MKIVYLAAGAGGMYCGSCLHDNTLAAALLSAGADLLLVPTYTPLRTDEPSVAQQKLFFGGINVYLQQKSALFRRTPWLLDDLLDALPLIRLATKWGPGVDASRLGDMTVSMLRGEHGRQRKELRKLVHWLRRDARPDVAHLSNSMLLGMAREIRALSIPIVCTLSGEDLFLEKLPEPYHSEARSELRRRTTDVDAFVAMNDYYADFMADYLIVPRERIHVIPHGLNLDGYAPRRDDRQDDGFTIGYLARVAPEKGLHHLVDAFASLLDDDSLPQLTLKVAGYLNPADRHYLDRILTQTRSWREPHRFHYLGEVTRAEKIEFLQSLDVMSVPTVYRESKGISILEALACGVPVVLPAHGAFPELVRATGGGLLHEPDNPRDLAATLRRLIQDRDLGRQLGHSGELAIRQRFRASDMATATLNLYRRICSERQSAASANTPRGTITTASVSAQAPRK